MKGIAILLVLISSMANADEIDEMMEDLKNKQADAVLFQQAIAQGHLRVRLCQICHGKDGNSVKPNVPNLAQQNAMYLLTQFELFGAGKRQNKVMNELARNLTLEERVNVALYYSSQKIVYEAKVADAALSQKGEAIYNKTCAGCHGDNGYGNKNLPRIAGQKAEFIRETLHNYKQGKAVRPASAMMQIATVLSDEDIEAIAAYAPTMQ